LISSISLLGRLYRVAGF